MSGALTVFRRELASYFATPLAYVFIVIFLALAGALAFFVGNFFDRGQADLELRVLPNSNQRQRVFLELLACGR